MTMSCGVLTSRANDRAGVGLDEVRVVELPAPADMWVVYVHGFNVRPAAAKDQLGLLRGRSQGEFVTGAGAVAWVAYQWPSQVTGSRTFNKLTYPKVLERVPAAGHVLGDYLATVGVRHIVLVGSSLGAHVVLKATVRMGQLGRPPDGLALLAAAVATKDVEPLGDYGVPHTDHESVTVNPDDSVLRKVFGAGERAARPFGPTPAAVGLTGDPTGRPWTRVRLHGTTHASYEQDHVEQAVAAACHARLSQPAGRVVASRHVGSAEPAGW